MDNVIITSEKFSNIVSDTILDCNRVIECWIKNSKRISTDDYTCLFKNYLSKHFRRVFGARFYNINIKAIDPIVIVNNNQISEISISNSYNNNYVEMIKKELLKTKFIINREISEPIIESTVENIVDYNKIINIKF